MSSVEVSRQPLHNSHNSFGSTEGDGRLTVASTVSGSFSVNSTYSHGTDRFSSLSRLSRASIKLRTTSSFPSILSLYEPIQEGKVYQGDRQKPPFTDRGPQRKKEKGKPKRFAKSKEWGEHLDTRFKTEPVRLSKPNRTIRIEAVAREQMDKYDKYIKELNTKVEKQRDQQRKRDEEFEERLKQLEEEGKKKHKIVKRPKEQFVHDREYVRNLPKSNLSKMVRLSDDLQKKGILKTPLDVDKFWKDFGRKSIDNTDIFKRDPLTEVPDSRHWIGKKTTLQSLDDKAKKRKLKKIYGSQDSNPLPTIPSRKSRQRKAKSSEENPGTKGSDKSKSAFDPSPGPSEKHSELTTPSEV
ncbi:uncharacterized protein LOC134706679 isoform X1 [Mytilus trossulus]|uniref:uncharacterized protein LOC134706679 isoform X1 n=1 Tax=Mytilus trossulus TaxID=6551 RepID=UPI00300514EA